MTKTLFHCPLWPLCVVSLTYATLSLYGSLYCIVLSGFLYSISLSGSIFFPSVAISILFSFVTTLYSNSLRLPLFCFSLWFLVKCWYETTPQVNFVGIDIVSHGVGTSWKVCSLGLTWQVTIIHTRFGLFLYFMILWMALIIKDFWFSGASLNSNTTWVLQHLFTHTSLSY